MYDVAAHKGIFGNAFTFETDQGWLTHVPKLSCACRRSS